MVATAAVTVGSVGVRRQMTRCLTGSIAAIHGSILIFTIAKIDLSTDVCHESMSRVVKMTFASGKYSMSSSTKCKQGISSIA
jgi:hypothetical protein